uniref:Uncharacterized protein n=1 Tax=Marseillevirus LCMAC101 TaxID=2506602 RepID=A0A481YTC5_9VIRU|nr:MAG: hypothetical protein LCMAC101_07560 [Marseillevirus LCMAC101]
MYQTSEEDSDIGGEGTLTSEKDDVDIISQMERKLGDLIEKYPSITKDEYTQFMTAMHVKQVNPDIPKLAKASGLSEDKTANILMSLEYLSKKFPDVERDIKGQKSRSRTSDTNERPPIKKKFRKKD